MFSIATHFYPICFCKYPSTYIGGPKVRISILQNTTFCFGEPPKFHLISVMGESNWLIETQKKVELGRHII
jgi:hypothetical protein